MITLQDVRQARARIAPYIVRTPLLRIPTLDEELGCEVYLKFEGFQAIGAFKIRGAMNKALALSPEERKNGLVCSSSGNHAQGVACAARQLGIRAVVVMPTNASPVKLAAVKALGGEVELLGTLASERDARIAELVRTQGLAEVHPFADPFVAAGQGTIGLEILEDLPGLDAVAAPIGGGGLVSGVATAVKELAPQVKTIGVEPAGAPRYAKSRAAGKPIILDHVDTIADGTRTNKANPGNFEMIQARVDELCAASDPSIRKAMKLLMEKAKLIVEPSGAMPVAAALDGTLPVKQGQKVAFVLSGGNVDTALAARLMAEQ